MDHSFTPPSQKGKTSSNANRSSNQASNRQTYTSWSYPEPWTGEEDDWEYHSTRSNSPRQRTQSPRQRQEPRRQRKPNQTQKHKGTGKGKQPVKGGPKGKGKSKAIEPPPWTNNATAPASASTQASSSVQTRAEAKLMEIVSVLKKKDDPELQTLAKEADVLHHKSATSKLHKAVTIHGDAKTVMLEA